MRLANKIAIITGAGAGIGEATAELFVKEGARVVLADLNFEKVQSVAKRLGDQALPIAVDVSKSGQVKAMVDATIEQFGALDILVNNAGYGILGNVVTTDEKAWDDLMNVDLKGVFLCSKHAIPHLEKRGRSAIVNIASTISVVGIKDRAAYVAAKGGVAALTRAMALDHIEQGIRVNSVAPGIIASSYFDKLIAEHPDPEAFKKWNDARAPIGRMGQPVEIAQMILFLASDESSLATGAMFTVDGGYTAW
ncbi:SDR family oxidoreductase [Variovorax sp. tm]|uniref:SDR family oxidoreductase n=1 Tax=Variovorax atrisoli TaxID=3394203 RepID=UPI003A811F99